MAGYSTSNPPRLVNSGGIDNSQLGGKRWAYYSPTDSAATVAGAGYFTNGKLLGLGVGDIVEVYDVGNTIVKTHQVLSYTGDATNLSAGTTIGAAS